MGCVYVKNCIFVFTRLKVVKVSRCVSLFLNKFGDDGFNPRVETCLLAEEGKELYKTFKESDMTNPADFEEQVKREQEWLDAVLEKQRRLQKEKADAAAGRCRVFSDPAPRAAVPVLVKRELISPERKNAFPKELKGIIQSGEVIDVSSPDAPRAASSSNGGSDGALGAAAMLDNPHAPTQEGASLHD